MVNLITENMDIWTAAQTQKANGGRGRKKNSNSQSLHGIKKLRELILELAVRGKLVLQDSNDLPANMLLKGIAQEKARLVKEGKIKKRKPLPPINEDEKPFELPNGWEWVRMGEVGDTNIGLTYSPSEVSDSGTPVLRANNIQDGKLDLTDLKRVDKEVKESVLVHKGDLLICARSGSRALVGKTALITGLSEDTAFGAFMAIFRSRINEYLLHFINSPLFRKMINEVNTMTINQITQNNLRSTIFSLPPLTEQHRIVAKVDALMALCDKLEQQQTDSNATHQTLVETLLTTLTNTVEQDESAEAWQHIGDHFDTLFTTEQSIDQLKQTILQLAVMGKLVPQDPNDEPAVVLLQRIAKEKIRLTKEGKIKKQKPLPEIGEDEKPFELPNGWEWVRMGEVGDTNIGLTYSPSEVSDSGTPVLRANNIQDGKLDLTDLKRVDKEVKESVLVHKGDLLICARSGSRALVGKTALITSLSEDTAFGAFMAIFRSRINEYLLHFINSPLFRKMINEVNTMTINQITQNNLRSTIFSLPPLTEQHRIVAKVDELLAVCDNLKTRLKDVQTTQIQFADAIVEQAVA